jgi:hypothetical protein
MQQLLRVLAGTVLIPGVLVAAGPAAADDGVVLVGCDLFANNGPRVAFVQAQGVSNGSSKRRQFVVSSGSRSNDFEGRECAEVLSAIIDDGLDFQAMQVFGQDSDLALWFFRED